MTASAQDGERPATAGRAQNTDKLDQWLNNNVKEMGGRTILVVWKDGRIVYHISINEMTRRQKMAELEFDLLGARRARAARRQRQRAAGHQRRTPYRTCENTCPLGCHDSLP